MKFNKIVLYCLLAVGLIHFSSCGTEADADGNGTGNGTDDPPAVEHSFEAVADPAEGGSVSPSSDTFEDGTQLSVQATANAGWQFASWSGDIESTDNPLNFAIEQNTSLTAHFLDFRSQYTTALSIADAESELDELGFGQDEDPEALDQPAPPNPPEGALDAWFERDGEKWFKDYRSNVETDVTWQLHYQVGSGEQLTLSWTIEATTMDGTLSLLGDDGSVLVQDMSAEDSFEFTAADYSYLLIQYVNE